MGGKEKTWRIIPLIPPSHYGGRDIKSTVETRFSFFLYLAHSPLLVLFFHIASSVWDVSFIRNFYSTFFALRFV